MRERARKWIEGNGFVRTVFRMLAHWPYSDEQVAKQRLRKTIEWTNGLSGPHVLQYAIYRRKKEVQWVSVYLPLFISFIVGLTLIAAALVTQNPRDLYLSLGLIVCMIIYFRVTIFSHYLYVCRLIYEAADVLSKESVPTIAPVTSNIGEQAGYKPELLPCLVDSSPADLLISSRPAKGTIILFLLDELIKKECNRPNIHRDDIHITIKCFAHASGCQPRNILKQVQSYASRNSIKLGTPNVRTTHLKYLDTLIEHYKEIGDNELYKQAEKLQFFIDNSANRKSQ